MSQKRPDYRRSNSKGSPQSIGNCPLILPGQLSGASKLEEATLCDVPDTQALAKWLLKRGLSTDDWGKAAGTKSVGKYWKELKEAESGLELWKTADGDLLPVRVTHVLRAKVCSAQSYERGVFLFNTWQQMADGQRRMRNGLLSEKLSTSEVPLMEHLHEVCERAVTHEEMQRVVEAAFSLGIGTKVPEYDPDVQCPIRVEDEHFIDYTTEVETSKSYPGLLTLYHLYTVEIICSGLPGFDFNTLEYDKPDKDGHRKLKYVHAWIWLEWPQIRRYLFEGSSLKERKTKGSFTHAEALHYWLSQFDLDLDQWGVDGRASVEDLFEELEEEETQLELWGRDDGVPLLMRVVHVLQLKVTSSDKRLFGKFLFQTYSQGKDGRVKPVNRLMSKKLSSAQMPFDEPRFMAAAEDAVKRQLTQLLDAHVQLHPGCPLEESQILESGVKVRNTEFKSHHFDVEESPSFMGMHTMYHLYLMELECERLPLTDFSSLEMTAHRGPTVNGWRWVCWPETLDVLHARNKGLERKDQAVRKALAAQRERLEASSATLDRLEQNVQFLQDDGIDAVNEDGAAALEDAQRQLQELREELQGFYTLAQVDLTVDTGSVAKLLPPAMVSNMASDKITSDAFLEEAQLMQRRSVRRRTRALKGFQAESASPSEASPSLRAGPAAPPVQQEEDLPVRLRPRWLGGRAGSLLLGVCATQAVGSLLLAAKAGTGGRDLGLRALFCGALGMAGVLLL